ncbi:MAG: hypothetical protein ACP5QK_06580 [Myxococcota bacterium]
MKNIKNKKSTKNKVSSAGSKKRREKIQKGTVMECMECGMVVVVDEVCGCEEYHPIVCCDEPMSIR